MSALKIQEGVTFAGQERCLRSFLEPVEGSVDVGDEVIDVITPPIALQTSYSDHP